MELEHGCLHEDSTIGSAGAPLRFVRKFGASGPDALRALVEPGRVHSAIYTSPEIFELEIERIFHGSWVYVGHASEVRETGEFRVRQLGRQPAIMVRGDDGAIRVLMNRCRHRGAAVCEVEAGREKFFRCWYHGWTYDNTGKLVSVTDPSGYGKSFSTGDYSLTPAPRVAIYRDFVFASLSEDVPPLEEHLGPAAAMIDLLVDASPDRQIELGAGVHKTVFNGNWKLVGMDGYHPHYVHASVLAKWKRKANSGASAAHSGSPFDSRAKTFTRDFGNGHAMLDMREHRMQHFSEYEKFLRGIPGGSEYIAALNDRDGEARATLLLAMAGDPHVSIFPNMQIIGNHVRIMLPLSAGRTEVLMFPALFKGVSPDINAVRLRQHESFYGPAGDGSPDDAEIFERVQRGLGAEVNPWIDISRGMERERIEADGTIVGHISDEVPQRGQMRRWLELLESGKANA
jgi:phenylpropionate dioxygenase-like ring-hydroxylating dioxygenase large terminal subunit